MNKWDDNGDNTLWLVTPEEFNKLPDGIMLESIGGEFCTKGTDYIDDDTRFGHLAYGLRDPFHSAYKDIFLLFMVGNDNSPKSYH